MSCYVLSCVCVPKIHRTWERAFAALNNSNTPAAAPEAYNSVTPNSLQATIVQNKGAAATGDLIAKLWRPAVKFLFDKEKHDDLGPVEKAEKQEEEKEKVSRLAKTLIPPT
jgi:hypothetical protein